METAGDRLPQAPLLNDSTRAALCLPRQLQVSNRINYSGTRGSDGQAVSH
jgi:hypothetical protein